MRTFPIATDLRGSTRVVREAAGRPAVAFDYDPFGQALATVAAPLAQRITRRYAGQIDEPECGLQDFGARHYDAVLARFVSADPLHQTPGSYAYCANDPVDCVDRDGRGFDRIQEIVVGGARYLRGFTNGVQAEADLPIEPPDIVLRYEPAMPGEMRQQFLRTYDLFRRYTETHVEPYDVAYVPPDRFVEYNAADRKAIWTTTLNVVRQVAPTAPIVTETAGSPDDEAFAHEEPVPELQSPADRSVSRGDEHSRTETASSLAAQDVPHALPDDLPDDLPNLIDADPAIVRSIVAHAQSPRPTVQPLVGESAQPIGTSARIVGRKLAHGALARLSRYAPFQQRPEALAALRRLAVRFLAPKARAQAYARVRSTHRTPPSPPDVEP